MLTFLFGFFFGAAAACVLCVFDPDLPGRWWDITRVRVRLWLDR